MDRRESCTLPPPSTGERRRPRSDAHAEEASSPKRQKPSDDRGHHRHDHGDRGDLAEAEEAGARVAMASPASGEPAKDGVGDGEKLDRGVASVDAGRGPGADPGDAGPASSAFAPPPAERSEDMFVDDIFGDSPIAVQKLHKEGGFRMKENSHHDNWDDEQGHYKYLIGEVVGGRYEIMAGCGNGVSSNVVRAKDLKAGKGDPDEVAIKIICNKPVTYKAGKQEISILEKLASANPEDKQHCVRFISNFMYRKHLCLVFESLHMNLREVLKKYGRDVGLSLTAVRTYSKQLFIALNHLKMCDVLHCDIKPDNVLVNEAVNVLKLCDFGSAASAGVNEITPILVSRFYRAPEIILGLPYGHPLDVWSVGCCLYELYTGNILFPGKTNNDMLRLHMDLKGPFPKKMLQKGAFTMQHFDQDLNFHAIHEESITKTASKRLITTIKQEGEDPKLLSKFKDLLGKIFVLDPEKRLKVPQALSHPFISGK